MAHVRAIITMSEETLEAQAAREPVYLRTAIPEGLGAPLTPESLAAACEEALEAASVPSGLHWTLPPEGEPDARRGPVPAVAVMERWRIGAPVQLWAASGPCRSYPAEFLAEFTLLGHHRGGEEREARRRPAQPKGWRAVWESWFPSSRDPVLRPQDRAIKSPPPAYFKVPDGNRQFPEPGSQIERALIKAAEIKDHH